MSWSPNLPPRPRTSGVWYPTKVFNPLGNESGPARGGIAGSTTRTTRSRATRGRAVPQRHTR
ncbi:MAG: hypothetical protein ACSLFR_01640 [Solirubrobacteraceae bacterium]